MLFERFKDETAHPQQANRLHSFLRDVLVFLPHFLRSPGTRLVTLRSHIWRDLHVEQRTMNVHHMIPHLLEENFAVLDSFLTIADDFFCYRLRSVHILLTPGGSNQAYQVKLHVRFREGLYDFLANRKTNFRRCVAGEGCRARWCWCGISRLSKSGNMYSNICSEQCGSMRNLDPLSRHGGFNFNVRHMDMIPESLRQREARARSIRVWVK